MIMLNYVIRGEYQLFLKHGLREFHEAWPGGPQVYFCLPSVR